jgi:hypothetical protein
VVDDWPFDQAKDVAAITTRRVIEDGLPILVVVHYADDHSWAFLCGITNEDAEGRVIGMGEALALDPTLGEIGDLKLGWEASRKAVGGEWIRQESRF